MFISKSKDSTLSSRSKRIPSAGPRSPCTRRLSFSSVLHPATVDILLNICLKTSKSAPSKIKLYLNNASVASNPSVHTGPMVLLVVNDDVDDRLATLSASPQALRSFTSRLDVKLPVSLRSHDVECRDSRLRGVDVRSSSDECCVCRQGTAGVDFSSLSDVTCNVPSSTGTSMLHKSYLS